MMIRNLQALRGVAALLIFYHHSGIDNVFTRSFGDFGVAFFMALSGFVLTYAHSRAGARDTSVPAFMRSRLAAIYPLYLLCWLLAVLFLPYRGSREGIVLSAVMLQSWVPDEGVYFAGNNVSWFVSDLMFCYLLFLPVMRLKGRAALAPGACYFAAYAAAVALVPDSLVQGIVYINPLMQLSSFLIGIMLGRLYLRRGDVSLDPVAATLAEAAAVALAVAAMALYDGIPARFASGCWWWLPAGLVIIVFALTDRSRGLIGRLLRTRPLLTLGTVSFSFYLLHGLGLRAWRAAVTHIEALAAIPPFMQTLIVIALLIAVSVPVETLLVRPLAHRLKSRSHHHYIN